MSENAENTTEAKTDLIAQPPKPKRHYFSRFSLEAPLVVNGQARPDVMSRLTFGTFRDNPFIEFRTNDPNERDDREMNYGKVTARMDPSTWGVLVLFIEALVANDKKDYKVIPNRNMYKGGQKFDEPQMINRTIVGRDDDGRIWIKIVEEGRPSPTFYFKPPAFHNQILNADKSEVEAGELSRNYALATIRGVNLAIMASMSRTSDEDEKTAGAEGESGGNRGNFNRNGGGGQWGNRGGGNWNNRGGGNGGGGYRGNGGGGGYNRGGGGGQWGNRNGGGGGGNWNNRGGGNGGGYNRGGGGGNGAPEVTDDEISF